MTAARRMPERAVEEAPSIDVLAAETPAQLDDVRALFREYAERLGVDLCFQNFERELAALPGEYAPPGGALLLATVDGALAGCGALRPLRDVDDADACELKRLYVRPPFRGFGIGRRLAEELIGHALRASYSTVLLDTLDDMEAARGLYGSLGFEEVPPYYYNPLPGAHYLRLDLRQHSTRW